MVAAVVLVALNIADALLVTQYLALGVIHLNPLSPPIMANLVARSLAAVAVSLVIFFFDKKNLLWWLDAAVLGFIGFHLVGNYLLLFGSTPS
jgi:hypothetical protein